MRSIKIFTATVLASCVLFASCDKDDDNSVTESFNTLTVPAAGYWNGSDNAGSFKVNGISFTNSFTSYPEGSYWSGFAYSNLHDFATVAWSNQYSCYALNEKSANTFVVAYPKMNYETNKYEENALEFDNVVSIQSIKVTNTTVAALIIKNGNSDAKKFGGDSGNDEDWFKLDIIGVDDKGISTDTVSFFLADYTFSDNTKDYIVNDWKTIDVSKLGKVKEIKFELTSSDNNQYGMKTPGYFCLDDVRYSK